MPLVAHTDLPTFDRLSDEGQLVLARDFASRQDIRELHVGLLNMMPDAALAATERQFFRLVGACNHIAQFHVHPFTIQGIERSPAAQAHIDRYYETFEQIRESGLDALIVSGANVTHSRLPEEPFWEPLGEVFDWAYENVTSTLCSCLATHALIEKRHGIARTRLPDKCWGVYSHTVQDRTHPLVVDINTRFDVPHSRFNEVFRDELEKAGIRVLVSSEKAGVHLAVSEDLFRVVYFQGHPEYDIVSLLKEFKREAIRFFHGERDDYPPFPENYFAAEAMAVLREYQAELERALEQGNALPDFPEQQIVDQMHITWRDTAKAVFNNWLGQIYQITHNDRDKPFMASVDPADPLGLRHTNQQSAE